MRDVSYSGFFNAEEVVRDRKGGVQISAEERAALLKLMEGAQVVRATGDYESDDDKLSEMTRWLVWPDGGAYLSRGCDGQVGVRAMFYEDSPAWAQRMKLLRETFPSDNQDKRNARVRQKTFVLVQTPHKSVSYHALGAIDARFEPGNYSCDVGEAFEYAVQELTNPTPAGRLTIIDGPPGTGKSFFIRGLIEKVVGAMFLYVPSDLVRDLGGPALMPTLLELKSSFKMPLVLVLEDADAILAPRMNDNINSVSTLLNFTDGLFGELLDLRVVATTNQKRVEVDAALQRDMRLSQIVHIPLPTEELKMSILARLVDPDDFGDLSRVTTLGSVYKYARKLGWVPPAPHGSSPMPDRHPRLTRMLDNIAPRIGFR